MIDTLVESTLTIEHKPLRAGIEGSYAFNTLRASSALPLSLQAQCERFVGSNGRSIYLAAHGEIPYWGDASPFSFSPSLYYTDRGGDVIWDGSLPSFDPVAQDTVQTTIRSTIRQSSPTLGAVLNMTWQPIKGLRIHAGPEVGFVLKSSYAKSQTLSSPGATFKEECDTCRYRFIGEGPTPSSNLLLAGISLGAGYEVPLSSSIYAEPRVTISYPFIGLTSYLHSWSYRIGLALHFDLTPRHETLPVFKTIKVPRTIAVAKQPEVVPRHERVTASIAAFGIARDGTQTKALTMAVEEVRSRNAFPILNYIFFDENSAEIPKRYVQYASRQEAKAKFKGSDTREDIKLTELYLETLNILGDRLRKGPSTNVTLIGATSNEGVEKDRLDLAKARAERVQQYLSDVWQIAKSRIRIEARHLPPQPSPVTTAAGREENRRVDIIVSDETVLDPITVFNKERLATPDRLVLRPEITADSDVVITSIRASVLANGRELISFAGDRLRAMKAWAITEDDLSQISDSLKLVLYVDDTTGQTTIAFGSIPVNLKKGVTERDERLERFSLILFSFDDATIGQKNERLLRQVANALPEIGVERVSVIGHTDESGSDEHNDQLSARRAQETQKLLERIMRQMKLQLPSRILTEGRGSKDQLYDNTLPEGRFFSRTVNIIIEKRK